MRRASPAPNPYTVFFFLLSLAMPTAVHATSKPPSPLVQALRPVAPPERLGPVWPIIEEDMRDLIAARLREHLPDLRTTLADRLTAYRAPAIAMPTRPDAKRLEIDPSITLAADLINHTGAVLAKSGDRMNPLRIIPLTRTYLVINGADQRQLLWAVDQITQRPAPTTVLLTDGSLNTAKTALPTGTSVYPAPAALFARFPIDSVPARLARTGDTITIDLVPDTILDTHDAHVAP